VSRAKTGAADKTITRTVRKEFMIFI